MIQLFAAILIIGLLIFILGMIPNAPDVLGFGLVGSGGAMTWFMLVFGGMAGLWFGWTLLSRSLAGQLFLDPILLRIPGVGRCLRSFAIARFAWCFALTQQSGMSIRPSLTSSLNATANGAFIAMEPVIWNEVHEGETLGDAFRTSNLFPDEFLHFVDTAEETGTVPEALDRMSHQFDEDAHRSLQWLTAAAGAWDLAACGPGDHLLHLPTGHVLREHAEQCGVRRIEHVTRSKLISSESRRLPPPCGVLPGP